jgi:hypothetical protein
MDTASNLLNTKIVSNGNASYSSRDSTVNNTFLQDEEMKRSLDISKGVGAGDIRNR